MCQYGVIMRTLIGWLVIAKCTSSQEALGALEGFVSEGYERNNLKVEYIPHLKNYTRYPVTDANGYNYNGL